MGKATNFCLQFSLLRWEGERRELYCFLPCTRFRSMLAKYGIICIWGSYKLFHKISNSAYWAILSVNSTIGKVAKVAFTSCCRWCKYLPSSSSWNPALKLSMQDSWHRGVKRKQRSKLTPISSRAMTLKKKKAEESKGQDTTAFHSKIIKKNKIFL